MHLHCNGQCYGQIYIKRGINQGDSLSSLLIIMALMPLLSILNKTNKGFVLEKDGLQLNYI